MDIRKEIINRIVNDEIASEEEAEEVIRWTFYNVNRATGLYDNIEIGGLGKFIFNLKKSKYHVKALSEKLSCLEGRKKADAEKMIDYINKKHEQNSGISQANSEGNS